MVSLGGMMEDRGVGGGNFGESEVRLKILVSQIKDRNLIDAPNSD